MRPGNDATGLARKHPAVGWDEGILTGSVFDFDNDGSHDPHGIQSPNDAL